MYVLMEYDDITMQMTPILTDQNPWWHDPLARRGAPFPHRRVLHGPVFRQLVRLDDRRATVIVGPRRVGKSVLLWQLADALLDEGWPPGNITYCDFSDDRFTAPLPTPREIAEVAPPAMDPRHPRAFLLDEIGSTEKWAAWLKQAVDTTPHRIVATDSAAVLLRQGGRESGMGRWDEHCMEGLTFLEYLGLQAQPGESAEAVLTRLPDPVERYLAAGGYPEHVLSDDLSQVRRRIRADVVDRAILRDIQRIGVRHVGKLKDLFVYLVEDSGAILDATARANDVGADPRSVAEWVRLLEETFLLAPLERHSGRATARLRGRAKPKIYAADHGLIVAFAPVDRPWTHPDVRGRVFEATVFRHLRGVVHELGGNLAYFRLPDGRLEIDLVLSNPDEVVAIEVTSSDIRADKVDRLHQAAEQLGASRKVLIHGGIGEKEQRGVHCLPIHRFLLHPEGVVSAKGN
jgi:predicted AAA+ superfamily ATPase